MSGAVFICQGGCGRYTPDAAEFLTRGLVTPRLYCPSCAELVDGYLMERDGLHTRVANDWAAGLSELHARYAVTDAEHPQGMRLPDG